MIKQGQTVTVLANNNIILNFENGILIEAGNVSGSGGGINPVNPDVWEGDINMLALTQFFDTGTSTNRYGIKTGLLINQGDNVTFTISGDYLQQWSGLSRSIIKDACYNSEKTTGYDANWSSETPWFGYNIYASCCIPDTTDIYEPWVDWIWGGIPDYTPTHSYVIPMNIYQTYTAINELVIDIDQYYGDTEPNPTVNGNYTIHVKAEITRV